MHKKYGTKDFAAVSVSLDEKDTDRENAAKFLRDKHATFTNLLLTAKPDEWQTKLDITGPPCVYVFDRDGRWVLKLPQKDAKGDIVEDVRYSIVEKEVAKLLGK